MDKQPLTRIAAVVERLVEICVAAAPGVQVVDGPIIGETDDDALFVGMPEGERSGYNSTVTAQQGRGGIRQREDWSVGFMLSLFTGMDDMSALRAKAVAILGAIDAGVSAEQVHAGIWDRAGMDGDVSWLPYQTDQGASLVVQFYISGAGLL
ncbi:hypothetical protein GCM10010401_14210 [Rarobacter faecitabidus]|uniref:DUF3168 domain-containing protein n=1 Tax=Rarobacter faecitabidus TaxID=13243 RepID=A0A542ZDW2_RARFA|nr:hypothetical protein [Rarobacter faecitabidus]TQL58532.1 hypothetical protein FB461_1947 [Rarobacter faecitabidus]